MLAGFLAVLGALSLGHVLSTTIRRRTHEFAVLRALGLERRPTRLILNAQGTSIAVIGLAIGLPLGLAIGRRAWSWVSGAISIQDEAPVITTVLLLSLPVTLLVVNGLAVLPGRRLARMRLADELRAE
jgi:ABC-type antimicrobial peptide transport system permease subunit